MTIHDLSTAAPEWREQAARLLFESFRDRSPAWPDLAAARTEVDDRRLGFQIVGVMPDANGPGKPDIIMAKRVGR